MDILELMESHHPGYYVHTVLVIRYHGDLVKEIFLRYIFVISPASSKKYKTSKRGKDLQRRSKVNWGDCCKKIVSRSNDKLGDF